jgi:hypothetical protein
MFQTFGLYAGSPTEAPRGRQMTRAAEYMEQARELAKLAGRTRNPDERLVLLEIAQAWKHLAEHSEEISNLLDEAKDMGVLPSKSEMH